ncbi:ABC transporter permease [Emticicia sp. 21SJ11W-3]|uniref:ABC transporter permease n=1 Tax=Emticicia sp. 21SJ11W-3 TaxID=2916755 RepID=UPI0020A17B2A|nr:ABC transporter permease [Emticicia sp. 21SJ11W-3]UTA67344.1 ABC transporter permease [Emticicia sp. 21SJ11W-3]
MIRNYLKVAWRNLWKNKTFSLLNIMGLALGMTCSLLIMLWLQDELQKDKFHKNGSRLYRVMENQFYAGEVVTYPSTPGILSQHITKDIPEIEMASQILWEESPLFTVGDIFEKEKGRYVNGDFLNMFSFELATGDARTALKRPDGVVISKRIADKYFPNQDPMGKIIRVDNRDDVMVTGVLKQITEQSSLKFDFLMSYDRWLKTNEWAKEWSNNGPRCYVMLNKNADIKKVQAKIKGYIKTKNKDSNVELFLQPYEDVYLYSNYKAGVQDGGRIDYVKMFSIIAVFILVIACINFMNLATARSVKRAKEVGVRKVVGALRYSLIGQFLGESLIIAFLSLIFAILLVFLILPAFNTLTDKHLSLNFTDPLFLLILLGLTIITGLVAGSYPALFMSSLKPVVVLKGSLKFKPSATFFRKGLVVFQFSLSIMLIVGMMVVYRQIQFIQTKNLGFDKENLIFSPIEGDLRANFTAFKQELLNMQGIKSVTSSQADPLQVGSSTQGVTWPGKDTTKTILFSQNPVSFDYLATMGIKLKDGRDFSPSFSTDTSNYIINEEAAKKMDMKDPVGKEMTMWGKKGTIIGLVKSFHINSLHESIPPLILNFQRGKENWGQIIVRAEAGKTREALASMEKAYKKFNPRFPFQYYFTDQEFADQYKGENVVSKLANYFAFLAIFISCLGLFGLAMFTAEQRTKEIGVRKVLGASVFSITAMLSKDFLKLVFIAALIAFPLAWYLMKNWLQKYAYRIEIQWWFFLVAGLVAVAIALLTVSYQSIKAALMNPMKSLKSE